MIYKCSKCDKVFSQKGHFDNLNRRKNPCINILNDHETSNIYNKVDIGFLTHNNTQTPHNNTQTPHNNTQTPHNNTQTNIIFTKDDKNKTINETLLIIAKNRCNYCNSLFSRKDALTRHLKNNCKIKRIIITILKKK